MEERRWIEWEEVAYDESDEGDVHETVVVVVVENDDVDDEKKLEEEQAAYLEVVMTSELQVVDLIQAHNQDSRSLDDDARYDDS